MFLIVGKFFLGDLKQKKKKKSKKYLAVKCSLVTKRTKYRCCQTARSAKTRATPYKTVKKEEYVFVNVLVVWRKVGVVEGQEIYTPWLTPLLCTLL